MNEAMRERFRGIVEGAKHTPGAITPGGWNSLKEKPVPPAKQLVEMDCPTGRKHINNRGQWTTDHQFCQDCNGSGTLQVSPQLWLALLEQKDCGFRGHGIYSPRCTCSESDCPCHSLSFQEVHGKRPLLPRLRKPCDHWGAEIIRAEGWDCVNCGGRGWTPEDDERALYRAMNAAGYDLSLLSAGYDPKRLSKANGYRSVVFTPTSDRWSNRHPETADANEWLAAVKALRKAGH